MALFGIQCGAGLALTGLLAVPLPANRIPPAQAPTHGVRAAVPAIAALVAEGRERSSTFRALLEELDASGWIVFVQRGACRLPGVSGCLLHGIGTFYGRHYLRVVITETSRPEDEAIATIGHELQHAVEVVNETGIAASRDFRELYRRIGYVSMRMVGAELYETTRAVKAGANIRQELRSGRRGHH